MSDTPLSLMDRPDILPTEVASIVQAYQRASKATSTVREYRGDAVLFEVWCAGYRFRSLLASPEAVAGFLSHEAESGRASSTIGLRLAAIRYVHKLARRPDPTDLEDVHAVMKGIRRRPGLVINQKAAATVDVLTAMLMHVPATLAGKRDKALLALGFAGAFRRSELVALDMSDLREDKDGLRVMVRRSRRTRKGGALRRPSHMGASSGPSPWCRIGSMRLGSRKALCSGRCNGRGGCGG